MRVGVSVLVLEVTLVIVAILKFLPTRTRSELHDLRYLGSCRSHNGLREANRG